ncbi:MAG: hypothetical protein ABIB79_05180 [archaeon]
MGKVKVSIEPLGEKGLNRVFDVSELNGKNIGHVLKRMVEEDWQGKDLVVTEGIRKEMRANGGYKVATEVGGENSPVRYEPISLRDPIRKYELQKGDDIPYSKITVLGNHVAGK